MKMKTNQKKSKRKTGELNEQPLLRIAGYLVTRDDRFEGWKGLRFALLFLCCGYLHELEDYRYGAYQQPR